MAANFPEDLAEVTSPATSEFLLVGDKKVTIANLLALAKAIVSIDGSYEARAETTAIPGSATSALASTDGAKYSQIGTSTTAGSTLAKSKSVDGTWEVESEESASASSSSVHRTTTVTDGANTAMQVAQIAAGTVTAGSQATQGAVDAILAAIAGAVAGQITATATDGVTTVGINGSTSGGLSLLARGATIPLNESGHEALPAGITSLVQGLRLLAALNGVPLEIGTWTPTMTAVSNVSVVTSTAGRFFRLGPLLLGVFRPTITPNIAGNAIVRASLPVPSDLSVSTHMFGIASGNDGVQGRCYADTVNDEVNVAVTRSATTAQSVDVFFLEVIN